MSQKLAALLVFLGGSALSSWSCPAQAQDQNLDSKEASPSAPAEASEGDDVTDSDLELKYFSSELGIGFRKGLGLELRCNWFKDDDMVLGIKAGQYTAKNIANFDQLTLTSLTLISRFNLESSFFFEAGVDYTQLKAKIDSSELSSLSGVGTYSFEGSVNQSYLLLSFGNQWEQGDWTYGINWLDLYLPFTGSGFAASSAGTIADRESRERQDRRDVKAEAWTINYGLSVHAGITF